MTNVPEPTTSARLSRIASEQKAVRQHLAVLHQHDADGREYEVPLAPSWQPLPGRPGVSIYHVPPPDGSQRLFLSVFSVAPGAEYSGSHLAESRLLAVLSGELECNGRQYGPGEFVWIAPGEPTAWKVRAGALGVTLYNVPPHDIDPDLLPSL